MFSSANQPVWVGSRRRTSSATYMYARPADASRYLTVPPTTTSATSAAPERQRARALVGVDEHQRAVPARDLANRGDVVHLAGAERDERRADERRPLVDRGRVCLRLRLDLDDLRAAQFLGMRDLADGRELVLGDDDPVPLAAEVERGDERADGGGDGGLDRDLVGLHREELGEAAADRLRPLDPVPPLGAVRVPAVEVLLVGGADGVRERALRAGVDVDLVAEDREAAANRLADERWAVSDSSLTRCQSRLWHRTGPQRPR